MRQAMAADKDIVGVCLGAQLLSVAAGGFDNDRVANTFCDFFVFRDVRG